MYVITEKISNNGNRVFDIDLKKPNLPNNVDVVIIKSQTFYFNYYIAHKYEEDYV